LIVPLRPFASFAVITICLETTQWLESYFASALIAVFDKAVPHMYYKSNVIPDYSGG
jgi:hypothetical protein